jgi:hypothetical protein
MAKKFLSARTSCSRPHRGKAERDAVMEKSNDNVRAIGVFDGILI